MVFVNRGEKKPQICSLPIWPLLYPSWDLHKLNSLKYSVSDLCEQTQLILITFCYVKKGSFRQVFGVNSIKAFEGNLYVLLNE